MVDGLRVAGASSRRLLAMACHPSGKPGIASSSPTRADCGAASSSRRSETPPPRGISSDSQNNGSTIYWMKLTNWSRRTASIISHSLTIALLERRRFLPLGPRPRGRPPPWFRQSAGPLHPARMPCSQYLARAARSEPILRLDPWSLGRTF